MNLPKNLDNAFNRLFIVPQETWQEELENLEIIATQDHGDCIVHHGLNRDDRSPRQLIQVAGLDLQFVNCPHLDLIP